MKGKVYHGTIKEDAVCSFIAFLIGFAVIIPILAFFERGVPYVTWFGIYIAATLLSNYVFILGCILFRNYAKEEKSDSIRFDDGTEETLP